MTSASPFPTLQQDLFVEPLSPPLRATLIALFASRLGIAADPTHGGAVPKPAATAREIRDHCKALAELGLAEERRGRFWITPGGKGLLKRNAA